MNNIVNVAVVGLGQVGNYLFNELIVKKKDIELKTGKKVNVVAISAKNINKKRGISFSKSVLQKNPFQITKDPKIDIIVELIGGADGIAKRIVFDALKNKKHVVTANKALIAKHGDALSVLSEKYEVNLLFEAAVGGGIPIIRSIKQGLIANKLHHIYGILNGTTNYILTEMELRGENFSNVLKDAQRLGYAESNPTADVDGYDAADKISILSSIGFGTKIINKGFLVEGIRNIEIDDIKFAKELGYKIKLLAIAERVKNEIKQINNLLFSSKKTRKNVVTEVEDLQVKLEVREELIRVTNTQVNYLTRKISLNERTISEQRKELEVLKEDYILTARAKGISQKRIRDRHAARTALLPVVTSFIFTIVTIIDGSVLTEQIFSWPGMGQLLLQSVLEEDLPVAMATFSFVGVFALIAHLVADISYSYLDPRIRIKSQG